MAKKYREVIVSCIGGKYINYKIVHIDIVLNNDFIVKYVYRDGLFYLSVWTCFIIFIAGLKNKDKFCDKLI